ncbi:MAG: patatin-like protein, partial [Ilumatobacteraceae bacterium]
MTGRNEDFDATREIRFGLVLYGGVSLSIYINGVVQELYRLVRATAPDREVPGTLRWSDADLTGSEIVYRELGRRLRDGVVADREHAETAVRTRFVVDLITGASAGGINGVFLAKALAADADLTALENLWIDKGDLSKLLNDKPSAKELKNDRLNTGNKSSLLNSKWMYHQLLKAVRKISETATAKGSATPYADAIDLWITSTDLEGRVVTVETTDSASLRVEERSNRALFHFAYDNQNGTGELRNDFVDENDAMLAFAARATSGFPVAFEPIRLADIDEMVAVADDQKVVRPKSSKDLMGFFPAYDPADVNRHSFADGGYLDNKPFEQILTTLPLRRATLKVERRLLYVEPDPGDPPIVSGSVEPKPSIFKVVLDAGTLPRNETISGDVSQIKGFGVASEARKSAYDELTAAIDERLNALTEESTAAAPEAVADSAPLPDKLVALAAGTSVPLKSRELEALADIVDDWSPTASAHRKARVNGVIDDFANMLSRILPATPQAPGSDFTDTMRHLVRWMRDREASPRPEPGRRRARLLTDREILRRFDVSFHMRRINFLQRRAIDWAVADLTDDGIRDAQKVRSALDVQFADLRMRARDVRRPATVDAANPCAEQRDRVVTAFRTCHG